MSGKLASQESTGCSRASSQNDLAVVTNELSGRLAPEKQQRTGRQAVATGLRNGDQVPMLVSSELYIDAQQVRWGCRMVPQSYSVFSASGRRDISLVQRMRRNQALVA
jgi:hypothetical protein